jgi:hypothetical protein
VARPQVAMAVVAAAATEEQTQVAAIMRYQRGSPMKVIQMKILLLDYYYYNSSLWLS